MSTAIQLYIWNPFVYMSSRRFLPRTVRSPDPHTSPIAYHPHTGAPATRSPPQLHNAARAHTSARHPRPATPGQLRTALTLAPAATAGLGHLRGHGPSGPQHLPRSACARRLRDCGGSEHSRGRGEHARVAQAVSRASLRCSRPQDCRCCMAGRAGGVGEGRRCR
jgi:hypothetical protein